MISGLLLDFYPWTGLALIILGGFVSTTGLFLDMDADVGRGPRVFVSVLLGLGMTAGVLQIHRSEPFLLVLVFAAAGKYVEGLAAMVLYQKVSYAVRNRTLSLPGVGLKTRVLAQLGVLFFLLLVGTVLSALAASDVVSLSASDLFVAVWTLFVVAYTSLGLAVKLSVANGDYPRLFTAGLISLVAGAEVYNFAEVEFEIAMLLLTSVAFSVGFWIAAYRFAEETDLSEHVHG